ncbi:MAG: hypothetical protein HY680_01545 [Chloroflexi bacterium]|nr:hypothetical protein [Chloroflexota bacterium]
MVQVEKLGLPAVAFVSRGFEDNFRHSAAAFGLATLAKADVPKVFTSMPHDEIQAMVDDAVPQIIASLTQPVTEGMLISAAEVLVPPAETVQVEGADFFDAVEKMNELFIQAEWSDGFPLVPPTRQAVERMLAGTKRSEKEVIAVLEPDFGTATVEKIAINAVMAGCRPEHLPVLIAAVQAVDDPHFMLRDAAVSTGAHSVMLLINGPIRKRIGINSAQSALGPGSPSWVNTVIGRAFRLIYMNIAGIYPGKGDTNTIGLPTKYGMCAGENEEQSPWEPYHVEVGFEPDASTVTVKSVTPFIKETVHFRATSPEPILDLAVNAAKFGGGAGWMLGGTADPDKNVEVHSQHIYLICPDHAHIMAKAGWSKDDVREYIFKHALVRVGNLANSMIARDEKGNWQRNRQLQWLERYPDLELPVVEKPEDFRLAVVGGPGSKSIWFGGREPAITRRIGE